MDDDAEAYILLLLADGNLPTGSFVASAGLESYIKHGFLNPRSSSTASRPLASASSAASCTVDFIHNSLGSYARSALPFVSDAHRLVSAHPPLEHADVLERLRALDSFYEATTLNHVARRASTSQGVALLTLYSKGFSRPPFLDAYDPSDNDDAPAVSLKLIDAFKLLIRRGETPGHLPVSWGVITAALGLSLQRSQHLCLFLHARSLLSAAIRLNTIGPYAAQQLLLHAVKPLVQAETARCTDLCTGLDILSVSAQNTNMDPATVPAEANDDNLEIGGPAFTWPLGEILAARHDLQHSRIFNS